MLIYCFQFYCPVIAGACVSNLLLRPGMSVRQVATRLMGPWFLPVPGLSYAADA